MVFQDITNRVQAADTATVKQKLGQLRPQPLAAGASDAQRHAYFTKCEAYVQYLKDAHASGFVGSEDLGEALQAYHGVLAGPSTDAQVLKRLEDKLDAMDKKFDKKFEALDAMDKKFDKKFEAMMAMIHNDRTRAQNKRHRDGDSNVTELVPLQAERGPNLGKAPSVGASRSTHASSSSSSSVPFPKTDTDLSNVSHAQLDQLARFYDVDDWGKDSSMHIEERKRRFKCFI